MFTLSYLALWALVLILSVAQFLLYRHFGRQLLEEKKRYESGGPAPGVPVDITVESIDGNVFRIGKAGGTPCLIAFTASRCLPCKQIQPALAELSRSAAEGELQLVVIHHGDPEKTSAYIEGMSNAVVAIADPKRELARLWEVGWTPYFVVVDETGVVESKGPALPSARSTLDALSRARRRRAVGAS